MADRDDLDRRLQAYESRIPDAEPPSLDAAPAGRRALLGAILALGAVAGVLLAVFLLGRPNPPIGEASPTQPATPAASASAPPSASPVAVGWGPLAVVDAAGDMARSEGTLLITAECAFLERGGELTLLVWPADRTEWNPDGDAISFATLRLMELALRTGDYVVLAGGGDGTEQSGIEPQEWVDTVDWVQRPADACLADSWWFVTDVESAGATPTPTPEPSPAAWVPLPMPPGDPQFQTAGGATEWNGMLVVVGSAGSPDGAIWVSGDGSTWERATTPPPPTEMGVLLQTPFAVGDRLLVFGITFNPAGSGPIGSVLWSSTDGLTWTDTSASTQFEGYPLRLIGVRGQTIVAAEGHELPSGSTFWVSEDAGVSWQRSTFDLEGSWATHGLVHDGTFIAVGATYTDSLSDGNVSVWTSADGLAWVQTDLGPGYTPRIGQLSDGTLLIIGDSGDDAVGWTSVDGREWSPSEVDLGCCGTEFAITPSGFVAVQSAGDGSGSVVSTSSDGLTWSVAGPLVGEMRDITWTETFGVVISGLDPEGRPAFIVGWDTE